MKNGALYDNSAVRIQAEKVSRKFGAITVFEGLDFSAAPGEAVAICGPNGSGKTTLLKILAGLLAPSSGKVRLLDGQREIPDTHAALMCTLAAPWINPYMHLTLQENLDCFLKLRVDWQGFGQINQDEADTLLDWSGLTKRRHDSLRAFSSGMVQRARLLLAAAAAPEILYLDEPTQNLDEAGWEFARRIAERQCNRGILVIATNEPRDLELASRVFDLNAGQGR